MRHRPTLRWSPKTALDLHHPEEVAFEDLMKKWTNFTSRTPRSGSHLFHNQSHLLTHYPDYAKVGVGVGVSQWQYLGTWLSLADVNVFKVQTLMFWRTSFLFFSVWPMLSTFLMLLRKLILIFFLEERPLLPLLPPLTPTFSQPILSPPSLFTHGQAHRMGSLVLHW